MKRILLLALVSATLIPAIARSAELRLMVLEKGSGDPVPQATVVTPAGEYTESDGKGDAWLEGVELPVRLKVMAIGYEPQELLFTSTAEPVTVYLMPLATHEMEAVEVVGDRVLEKTSKVALSREELLQAPGSMGDPIKAVQSMPGVVTATEGGGMMYMRGSDTMDNSVRINGMPVNYLYHWGGLQSTVNPSLVSDFNIFLGGFPVEYGDYLGGAIDVRLRAPKNDRLHQEYQIGTYESSFLVEGPIGESGTDSYYVAARRSYIDLLMDPKQFSDFIKKDGEDVSNSFITVPTFFDAQAAWHHELKGGAIEFQYLGAGDRIALLNNRATNSDPDLAGELSLSNSYHTAGLHWQQRWSEQWSHVTVFSANTYSERVRAGSDANGNPFYSNLDPWTVYAQPELRWQRSPTTRYSFGTELEHIHFPVELYAARPQAPGEVDYDFTTAPKIHIRRTVLADQISPYVKQTRDWGEHLTTSVGLRYSSVRGSGGIDTKGWSPRLSMEYRLTPDLALTAAWGRYLQLPSSNYLLKDYGNAGLDFTEAEHRIIGLRYALAPLWSVQVEAYHKPMSKLVVGVADSTERYRNGGSGAAYGADLLIKRESGDGRMGWLSYSYAKSSRTNDLTGERNDFAGDQPHTLTLLWSQPLSGNWRRWKAGVRLQTASGKPYTAVIGRTQETLADGRTRYRPIYGASFGSRLPNYFRVDLRFDRTVYFDRQKAKFYIDIQNVTFSDNVTGYDYGADYQRYANPRKVVGTPFMPFFGMEMRF